jgi:hypothetical protein
MPRSSVITAACALLVRGWCTTGDEVVLDFLVSRRVHPESTTLPGMIAGVVPLVLRISPESGVVIFALTTILASGATLGTQIGAAIVFILETLAVVEIVLVSNLSHRLTDTERDNLPGHHK